MVVRLNLYSPPCYRKRNEEEAWQAAEELIKYVDDEMIENSQKIFERFDSVKSKKNC